MFKQLYSSKQVQTGLAVDVDSVRVDYYNVGSLEYIFITTGVTKEDANDAIEKIMRQMETDSFDHWQQWRVSEIERDDSNMERYGQYVVHVKFRIRDSY